MRVLVVGSVTRDRNVHEGVARQALGGTILYAARTYASLGVECRVLSAAADVDWADIRGALPVGVDCRLIASAHTTAFENTYLADGTRAQRAPRLARPLPFVTDALADVDWVHLGPLHPDDLDAAWYQTSAAPLSLDLQGLTRRVVGGAVEPGVDTRLVGWLPGFAWLKGSAREWKLVETTLGDLRGAFHAGAERLVTRGIEGGTLIAPRVSEAWCAAPPVPGRDPTGAGDVYFAAYLCERHTGASASAAAARAARFTSEFLLAR